MIAIILNILLLVLEARAFSLCFPEGKWKLFIFYTQISNMTATASSVMFLIAGQLYFVTAFRYLGVCMMIMTCLVTVCVLVPMSKNPKWLLWSGSCFYHHLLCPALMAVSYIFFENHVGWDMLILPILVTLAYGLIMIVLNAVRVVDGPYPFFWVHKQSVPVTILWIAALLAVIAGISALVCLV